MKIFKCDFCDKYKSCTTTTIDNVNYDICMECKAERQAKLQGKGEPIFLQTIPQRRWSDWPPLWVQPYYIPYQSPTPVNPFRTTFSFGNNSGYVNSTLLALNQ